MIGFVASFELSKFVMSKDTLDKMNLELWVVQRICTIYTLKQTFAKTK